MISEAFQKYYELNWASCVCSTIDIAVTDGSGYFIPATQPFTVGSISAEQFTELCGQGVIYRHYEKASEIH